MNMSVLNIISGVPEGFILHVNSVLKMLHCVEVGDVTHASEVNAASIFRIKVRRFVGFCVQWNLA